MTINDVRYAVKHALNDAFPDIPVLDAEPDEQSNASGFYVKLLESEHVQETGRRFLRKHAFDIHYVAVDQQEDDLFDVAERLTAAVQLVDVAERPVRGTGMRVEAADGVLHFFVEYQIHVWAPKIDAQSMQALETQEGLK